MAFFRLRIIQIEKKKFWKFFIFLKILTKNDPFWPKFRPKKPNLTKNIFFVILKSYDFQRGVTCLCLKKFNFSVPKRVVGPKIRKTGVFGKNPAVSLSSLYQVVTCCQVSEKSLEPFWRKWCEYLTNYLTVTSRGTSSPLGALGRVCLFSILLSCFRLKLNTVFFLFLPIFLLKLFNTCFTGWNCWVLIGTVGYWLELLGTGWNCWVLIGTVGYCLVLFETV